MQSQLTRGLVPNQQDNGPQQLNHDEKHHQQVPDEERVDQDALVMPVLRIWNKFSKRFKNDDTLLDSSTYQPLPYNCP